MSGREWLVLLKGEDQEEARRWKKARSEEAGRGEGGVGESSGRVMGLDGLTGQWEWEWKKKVGGRRRWELTRSSPVKPISQSLTLEKEQGQVRGGPGTVSRIHYPVLSHCIKCENGKGKKLCLRRRQRLVIHYYQKEIQRTFVQHKITHAKCEASSKGCMVP